MPIAPPPLYIPYTVNIENSENLIGQHYLDCILTCKKIDIINMGVGPPQSFNHWQSNFSVMVVTWYPMILGIP